MKLLRLSSVPVRERSDFLSFLLMADESEAAVKEYINEGDLLSILMNNVPAGVILFTEISDEVVELKNFALLPEFRGNGLGKSIIQEALRLQKEKGVKKVIVGTANSSIGNIAFYQKAGFRMAGVKRDFFARYPDPIFENGIRALDMIMFEKMLIKGEIDG
ncbi:GNAT family N-acetyltransferase [Bacillus sp. AK031]